MELQAVEADDGRGKQGVSDSTHSAGMNIDSWILCMLPMLTSEWINTRVCTIESRMVLQDQFMKTPSKINRDLQRQVHRLKRAIADSPLAEDLFPYGSQLDLIQDRLSKTQKSISLLSDSQESADLLSRLITDAPSFDIQIDPCIYSAGADSVEVDELVIHSCSLQGRSESCRIQREGSKRHRIGRNNQSCDITIDRELTLVSGVHAEVKVNTEGSLVIRDLDSLNGTYIAGKKLSSKKWHPVPLNEIIVLGATTALEGTATLTFTPKRSANKANEIRPLLGISPIVILIVTQQSIETVLNFCRSLPKYHLPASAILLVNRNSWDAQDQDCQIIQQKFLSVFHKTIVLPLYFSPFTRSEGGTLLIPEAQPEYDYLLETITSIINDESLATRALLHSFEGVLQQILSVSEQKLELAKGSELDRSSSKSISASMLRSRVDLADFPNTIIAKFDQLLQSFKPIILQRKAELLDDYSPKSISRAMDTQFSSLRTVIKRVDSDLLRVSFLPPQDSLSEESFHVYLLNYCNQVLLTWANSLQESVLDGENGLNRIYSQMADDNNLISSDVDDKISSSPTLVVDLSEILRSDIVPPTAFTLVRFPGFFAYILKNLRVQIMSVGGTIVIVGGMLTPQIRDIVKDTILPALLPIIAVITWMAYKKECQQKCEESLEKLKKELKSYYAVYVKSSLDKISSALVAALVDEQSQLKQKLEILKRSKSNLSDGAKDSQMPQAEEIPLKSLSTASISRLERQIESIKNMIKDVTSIELD